MMERINHLLVISPSFPENAKNEIVVPPLHLYLRQLRKEYPNLWISVISIHFPFHHTDYNLYDVDVYPCGGANSTLLKRPLIWLRVFKKARRLKSFDMIHSFWLNESAFIAQALSRKYKVPHVCTLMGQDALPSNRYLRFLNLAKIKLVTLSEFQKNVLQKHQKTEDITVIPWGIADFDISSETFANKPIDLICVSSLIPLKRVHLFIKLIEQLKLQHPNISAIIVGGGSLENELTSMIKKLQLERNITLYGLKDRSQTLELMQQSKALIHTSSYEAQGYVINEALAKGCNVFALSRGFIMRDEKFHCVDDFESLLQSVSTFMLSSKTDYTSHVPLSMADTTSNYQTLVKELGLHF